MKPLKEEPLTQRIGYSLFGRLTRIVTALLFFTCRVQVFGRKIEKKYEKENPGKGLLYASWHRGIIFLMYFYRNRDFLVMASASKDGELAAQASKRHGWIVVRGSSSYRGTQALRKMVPYFKKGYRGGLVVDAPQGPANVSKIGIIMASRMADAPIIPVIWSADRYWRVKSWDRTIIPKPFSRITFLYNKELIQVPKKASREECEEYRQLLDRTLNLLKYQVDHFFNTPGITDPRQIEVPEGVFKNE